MSPAETTVEVLSVGPLPETHRMLRSILQHTNWRIHCVESRQEACRLLRDHPLGVVISEDQLPDGTWRDLLTDVSETAARPYVIVTSRLSDEKLWMEVIEAGGFDVLARPLESSEVRRVIAVGWRHWHDRATHAPRTAAA